MQPLREVECAQERDSSPVIFGAYVDGARQTPEVLERTPSAKGSAGTTREALSSSVELKLGAAAVATSADDAGEETQPGLQSQLAPKDGPLENLPSSDASSGDASSSDAASNDASSGDPVDLALEDTDAERSAVHHQRVVKVWRGWLETLARDPEAALAAAQAYQQMDAAGRDEWLRALEADVASLGVPSVAVYAPLLAVESDPHRLRQIMQVLAHSREVVACKVVRRALRGRLPGGVQVAVLVEPLYLDFVQVLACGYVPGERFLWVRHDPIASGSQALSKVGTLEGADLEPTPLRGVVDDLARTIVAHRRYGGTLPEALRLFADVFGLDPATGVQDESLPRWGD
jgi:hypothetical protein